MRFPTKEPGKPRRGWTPRLWPWRRSAEKRRVEHFREWKRANEDLVEREEGAQVALARNEQATRIRAVQLISAIRARIRPISLEVLEKEQAEELQIRNYVLPENASDEEKKLGYQVVGGRLNLSHAAHSLHEMAEHIHHIKKRQVMKDIAENASYELKGLKTLKLGEVELYNSLEGVRGTFNNIWKKEAQTEAAIVKALKERLKGTEVEEMVEKDTHPHHGAVIPQLTEIAKAIETQFNKKKDWQGYLKKTERSIKALISELDKAIAYAKMELKELRSPGHMREIVGRLRIMAREIADREEQIFDNLSAALAQLGILQKKYISLIEGQNELIKELAERTGLEDLHKIVVPET